MGNMNALSNSEVCRNCAYYTHAVVSLLSANSARESDFTDNLGQFHWPMICILFLPVLHGTLDVNRTARAATQDPLHCQQLDQ